MKLLHSAYFPPLDTEFQRIDAFLAKYLFMREESNIGHIEFPN